MLLTLLVALPMVAFMPHSEGNLQGAWQLQSYLLKNGARRDVEGLLLFTESSWSVVFFILDGATPERGSAEAGAYTLEGDRLIFFHRYNLSGGKSIEHVPGQSPIRMTARSKGEAVEEVCRVEMQDKGLTIYFPSGNQLVLVRAGD